MNPTAEEIEVYRLMRAGVDFEGGGLSLERYRQISIYLKTPREAAQ